MKRFHVQIRKGGKWVNHQPRWAKTSALTWATATAVHRQQVKRLGEKNVRRRPVPTVYPNRTHLSPNFTRAELRSKDGTFVPKHLEPNAVALCRVLEKVRRKTGLVPLLSAFRSLHDNNRVKGARDSKHMQAMAADLNVPAILASWSKRGLRRRQRTRQDLIKLLRSIPEIHGLGIYPNGGIHVDVRPGPREEWSYFKR